MSLPLWPLFRLASIVADAAVAPTETPPITVNPGAAAATEVDYDTSHKFVQRTFKRKPKKGTENHQIIKAMAGFQEEGMNIGNKSFKVNVLPKSRITNTYKLYGELIDRKKTVKSFIKDKINSYLRNIISPTSNNNQIYITESWISTSKPGHSHHEHHHSNSFLSGVMYLETIEENVIIFTNPNSQLFHFQQYHLHLNQRGKSCQDSNQHYKVMVRRDDRYHRQTAPHHQRQNSLDL